VFTSANMEHPQALAMFILSANGQRVLAARCFAAPALPQ
jgi:hypothetical protein